MNGITANQWLDISTLRPINCVDDPAFMGNYTDESSSPALLLTSTIADELKIATRNKGWYTLLPLSVMLPYLQQDIPETVLSG